MVTSKFVFKGLRYYKYFEKESSNLITRGGLIKEVYFTPLSLKKGPYFLSVICM